MQHGLAGLRAAALLASGILFIALGCGGKAAKPEATTQTAGDAGSSPVSSGAGAEAMEPNAEPSTVRISGSSQVVDINASPECLQGFQGFQAQLGDMNVDFKAFVAEPGDYTGDPIQILWLSVRRTDGRRYLASAGAALGGGEIALHVDAVAPRFQGNLIASLPNEEDASDEPLHLALTFDIAVRAGCS